MLVVQPVKVAQMLIDGGVLWPHHLILMVGAMPAHAAEAVEFIDVGWVAAIATFMFGHRLSPLFYVRIPFVYLDI